MTNKLSPAAQAVLNAANQLRVAYQNEEYVDPADDYLYSIATELEARP